MSEQTEDKSSFVDRYFEISKRNTTIKTEIVAGITTFLAMAYIIFVNPSILNQGGIPLEAAIAATIWSAAISTIMMALYANLPVAVAPGMGLNAFFSFYVCGTVGLYWETALGAVFISGIVFFILTVTRLRHYIINAVPMSIKCAVVVGIGLFISFVGLQNSGIIVDNKATKVAIGELSQPEVLLTCFGVLLTGVLLARKVRGSLLIGIVVVTVMGMIFGLTPAPAAITDVVSLEFPSLADTFMRMDVVGALQYGLISVIFTFTVVELFDNIGTLIGVSRAAGLMEKDGRIRHLDRALLTDSCGTMVSAALGTSTVTSYVESAAGANAGGRTGLTALTVGVCFILALFLFPLISLVPTYATAPALIIVGGMMLRNIEGINFDDFTDVLPAFFTIIMMPLSYSIASGFGFGFASYCLIKFFSGKYSEVSVVMWVVTAVFVISFAMR